MYIRVTPKQLKKMKDFMKTVKLQAYDITIYNEILKGLDNPIDEIQKEKKNSSEKINEITTNEHKIKTNVTNTKLTSNEKSTAKIVVENIILEKEIEDILDDYIEEEDNINNVSEESNQDIVNTEKIESSTEISFTDLDNVEPMSVIDRRTKKNKINNYYI